MYNWYVFSFRVERKRAIQLKSAGLKGTIMHEEIWKYVGDALCRFLKLHIHIVRIQVFNVGAIKSHRKFYGCA